MGLLLITIIGTVIGTLLASEAKAWLPRLSLRLLRHTLSGLPRELPAESKRRWVEEIEADLLDYEARPLGGFAFAFRVYRRGARDLAAELLLRDELAHSGALVTTPRAEGAVGG